MAEGRVAMRCSCGCSSLVFEKDDDGILSEYSAYIECPYDSVGVTFRQRVKRAYAMLSGKPYKYWCGSVCARNKESVILFAEEILRLCGE